MSSDSEQQQVSSDASAPLPADNIQQSEVPAATSKLLPLCVNNTEVAFKIETHSDFTAVIFKMEANYTEIQQPDILIATVLKIEEKDTLIAALQLKISENEAKMKEDREKQIAENLLKIANLQSEIEKREEKITQALAMGELVEMMKVLENGMER